MLHLEIRGLIPKVLRPVISQRRLLSAVKNSYEIELSPSQFSYYNCPEFDLKVKITRDELMHAFWRMNYIRRFETVCDELYKAREIRGFCHLSIGQEAIAAGIELGSNPDDAIITSYRCHGMSLIRGMSAECILAELAGRATGCSKGKGGSMHMFSKTFYGGNGIVGAQVPLGTGIAFAQKYLKSNKATFTLYGDGAANQGQVYESFNIAKIWEIPVIYICENNIYGMGTPTHVSSATSEFFSKCPYIPGFRADGMDAIAMKKAIEFTRDWTLSGKGPIIMEALTYRYVGHSMSDPGTSYRKKDEVSAYRKEHDAINKMKSLILNIGAATEEELDIVNKKIRSEMNEVRDKVLASKFPDPSELLTDIYTINDPKTRTTLPEEYA